MPRDEARVLWNSSSNFEASTRSRQKLPGLPTIAVHREASNGETALAPTGNASGNEQIAGEINRCISVRCLPEKKEWWPTALPRGQ